MDDAAFGKQKRRLLKLANRWIGPLGLKWWKLDLVYSRTPLDSSKPGFYCQAKTSVAWEYLDATITWNMEAIEGLSDEELEKIFVHECCHILVNEMRMWGPSKLDEEKLHEAMLHEERVVTQLALAFLWTRKDGSGELSCARTRLKRKKV